MPAIRASWLYPAVGLVLYALAGFTLAPWLLERELKSVLTERLGLHTDIDNLTINPFTFTLTANGLDVTEDGDPLFRVERFHLNWELSSILHRAWHFQALHLDTPGVHLERHSESDNSFGRLATRWQADAPPEDPVPAPATDSLLPRLMIDDLLINNGRLSVTDQVPAEAFETELGPIELHVADFSTLPQASGTQQVSISLETGGRLAWTGAVSVNPLSIGGRLTLQGTYTPMLFRYFRDRLNLPITFDGGNLDAELTYAVALNDAGVLAVEISDLGGTLTDLAINQPDHPHLAEIGTFEVRGGVLRFPERQVHFDHISFDQVAIDAYRDDRGRYLPVDTSSSDSAAPSEADDPVAGWQLSAGVVRLGNWRISHTDLPRDALTRLTDLNVTLTELSNADGAALPFEVGGRLSEGGRIDAGGTLRLLPELAVEAQLTAEALALETLQPYLSEFVLATIESGTVTFDGTLRVTPDLQVAYDGNLTIDSLEMLDQLEREKFLSFSRLSLDQLRLASDTLAVSTLTLTDPYARIEIAEDGSNNIARLFVAGSGSEPEPRNGTFNLEIGRTAMENGSASFSDLALPLPFQAAISHLNGGLTSLASVSREPARIELNGQVNEYGQVRIEGSLMQPMSPTDGSDVTVRFENVNLPRMSPYTIKFAGRRIDEGRIDLDLAYRFDNGSLEGTNQMLIRDLVLGDRVEQPDAMNLPLDMAVALLKDTDGIIDLAFPVSGSLDDPQFSYADAVGKAFANVITGLASAPFRLLGSLVGGSPREMEQIRFPAGSSELSPPAMEALDQLAAALEQRPALTLAMPPVIAPVADDLALRTVLVDEQIEQRLAVGTTGGSDTTLLTEQRRAVLEDLYGTAGILPPSREVAQSHLLDDATGGSSVDLIAYTTALRSSLIDAASIAPNQLGDLADQRSRTAITRLTRTGTLDPSRITTAEMLEVKAAADGAVPMPLTLSVGD
jgi:hypothetical protein